jgi:predicted DNA-binding transcriptional regulator AlpA
MIKRPDPPAPDYVHSIAERAASIGIGENTLRRMISKGEGPTVIQLSKRRLGIRDSAWSAWIAARETRPGAHEQTAA